MRPVSYSLVPWCPLATATSNGHPEHFWFACVFRLWVKRGNRCPEIFVYCILRYPVELRIDTVQNHQCQALTNEHQQPLLLPVFWKKLREGQRVGSGTYMPQTMDAQSPLCRVSGRNSAQMSSNLHVTIPWNSADPYACHIGLLPNWQKSCLQCLQFFTETFWKMRSKCVLPLNKCLPKQNSRLSRNKSNMFTNHWTHVRPCRRALEGFWSADIGSFSLLLTCVIICARVCG